MANFYDIAYVTGLALSSPYWLLRGRLRRKVFTALRNRCGEAPQIASSQPAVLIHAVSVGEINATPPLVAALRSARPDLAFVVSTTTDDGLTRGRELYPAGADVLLVRYPLDLSWMVGRFLDRLGPAVVVLMELEVWPNFLRACAKRSVPVVLANGRLTDGSFHRYSLVKGIAAKMFGALAALCVQDETYAQRFVALGAAPHGVHICGTMKFDTAAVANSVAGDAELAVALGLGGPDPIWVCGSTGPGEEAIILGVYRRLLASHPKLRLAIVPRHRARFDEVARIIREHHFGLVRRSCIQLPPPSSPTAVILGDTMGELRRFYALANVVLVGRSLVDLGHRQNGSDMIEPAALAKPVVVGSYTANFAQPMRLFLAADAMRVVRGEGELHAALATLLSSPPQAAAMGKRAQQVVRQNQGSTARHAQIILQQLERRPAAGR